MVRRHVILCNFDPLRAIILRDRILVIVPEGADSLLVDLERRVRGGIQEYENSVFGDASEEDNAAIRRYKKKPSGGVSRVSKAVQKSANLVKKAMGRHSGHAAVAVPPPPPPSSGNSPSPAVLTYNDDSSHRRRGGGVGPPPIPPREQVLSDGAIQDEDDFAELDSGEFEDLKGEGWKELPFELQCADGEFGCVSVCLLGFTNVQCPLHHSCASCSDKWIVRGHV